MAQEPRSLLSLNTSRGETTRTIEEGGEQIFDRIRNPDVEQTTVCDTVQMTSFQVMYKIRPSKTWDLCGSRVATKKHHCVLQLRHWVFTEMFLS